jgi:hypothetical protein
MSYQTPVLKFLLNNLFRQMPFTKKDLQDLPISFCDKDEVWVIVGPCSGTYWREYKIALDGRKYHTGGTVIFKNGQTFRASFYVDTSTFNFVKKDSIYLKIGADWYNIEEPELLVKLNVTADDIFPLKWQTDRPLDYHVKPPFTLTK